MEFIGEKLWFVNEIFVINSWKFIIVFVYILKFG